MKARILVAFVAALCVACSGPAVIKKQPTMPLETTEEYVVGVGDQLNIQVWKSPELSISVPVRPDGKISVPLTGDVTAAGLAAEKLADNIARSYSQFVRNPQVTVIVTNPASANYARRIRITGAVGSPQSIPYQKGMTVLDLVLSAGGLTEFARGNSAKLYRKNGERVEIFPIYLDDILERGQLGSNYELAPSDMITIPERVF